SRTYNNLAGDISFQVSGLGTFTCNNVSASATVTAAFGVSISGPASLTISNCHLITTNWVASINIPYGSMITAVPASLPQTSVSGPVSYTVLSLCGANNGTTTTLGFSGTAAATGAAPPSPGPSPTSWAPSAMQGSTTKQTQQVTFSPSAPLIYST